jgi:hypothetical protein
MVTWWVITQERHIYTHPGNWKDHFGKDLTPIRGEIHSTCLSAFLKGIIDSSMGVLSWGVAHYTADVLPTSPYVCRDGKFKTRTLAECKLVFHAYCTYVHYLPCTLRWFPGLSCNQSRWGILVFVVRWILMIGSTLWTVGPLCAPWVYPVPMTRTNARWIAFSAIHQHTRRHFYYHMLLVLSVFPISSAVNRSIHVLSIDHLYVFYRASLLALLRR